MLPPDLLPLLSEYIDDAYAVGIGFFTAVILVYLTLLIRRGAVGSGPSDDGLSSMAELLQEEGEADFRRLLADNGCDDEQIESDLAAAYEELGLDPNDPDDYN